ncbi:10211_t:CDS:2, partial [Gigaspora margarita]
LDVDQAQIHNITPFNGEDAYRKQVVIDDHPCVLEILETNGTEEYTALRDQWIRCCIHNKCRETFLKSMIFHDKCGQINFRFNDFFLFRDGEGFLLVYSISARSSFERLERFHDQVTRIKDTEHIPIMLVGNKCDKITEREVSREEGMNMARRLKCGFIETSAKTCVNEHRAFYGVVRMIRQNREGDNSRRNKKKM